MIDLVLALEVWVKAGRAQPGLLHGARSCSDRYMCCASPLVVDLAQPEDPA